MRKNQVQRRSKGGPSLYLKIVKKKIGCPATLQSRSYAPRKSKSPGTTVRNQSRKGISKSTIRKREIQGRLRREGCLAEKRLNLEICGGCIPQGDRGRVPTMKAKKGRYKLKKQRRVREGGTKEVGIQFSPFHGRCGLPSENYSRRGSSSLSHQHLAAARPSSSISCCRICLIGNK